MSHHQRTLRRAALSLLIVSGLYANAASATAISGAIFTTDQTGTVVDGNNYNAKADVYLDGGPNNAPGCNGGALENGDYYSR